MKLGLKSNIHVLTRKQGLLRILLHIFSNLYKRQDAINTLLEAGHFFFSLKVLNSNPGIKFSIRGEKYKFIALNKK